MKIYPLIEFPFNNTFEELSDEEAEITFEWLLRIKSERIAILADSITKTNRNWKPDFSKNSLLELGNWMKNTVNWVPLSKKDQEKYIKDNNLKGLSAQLTRERKLTITQAQYRIRFDSCLYLGETLCANIVQLKWDIGRDKRVTHFNKPVLRVPAYESKKYLTMNILAIGNTCFVKSSKYKTPNAYISIFEHWQDKFAKQI